MIAEKKLHPPPCEGKGCLRMRPLEKRCWSDVVRSCGMLFISLIHYCVGACVQGIKPPTFSYPKETHPQEAGIAVCSPPSNHVKDEVELQLQS
jgi:hypothetical protein